MIEEEALVDPAPAVGPLSTQITDRPPRASSSATEEPMMPAPMTTASAVASATQEVLLPVAGCVDPVEREQVQAADAQPVGVLGDVGHEIRRVVAAVPEQRAHRRPLVADEPQRGTDTEAHTHAHQLDPIDHSRNAEVDGQLEAAIAFLGEPALD